MHLMCPGGHSREAPQRESLTVGTVKHCVTRSTVTIVLSGNVRSEVQPSLQNPAERSCPPRAREQSLSESLVPAEH